jgi:exosome complex component RRP4
VLLVEDKQIVVPGEILAEGDYHSGRGTFKEEEKVCSSLVGLVAVRDKKISVIPLQSKYIPKRGDVVIGEITDIRFSMWNLDINSPYSGILPAAEVFGKEKRELNRAFDVGDVLFLRVVDVDEVKKVKLGLKGRGLGKFRGGILIHITPTKVPRLIGKKGSMINMIKDQTRCEVVVGQNGIVWVKGKPEMERVVQKVVKTIEEEAHTSGLTDRIRDMLMELLEEGTEKTETEETSKKEEEDFKEELIQ